MIARVLVNTGSTVRTCGIIYKGLAQSVLLYISDIWVVMGDMLKVLEGFHHDTARRITGNDGDMWGGRGVVIPPGGDGNVLGSHAEKLYEGLVDDLQGSSP